MVEIHILYIFLLHLSIELGQGSKGDGPKWDEMLPSFHKEPCVSILATDLVPYQGELLLSTPIFCDFLCFSHLLEIGTSTLRCKDATELLKLRGNLLFSSISASISCLVTIVETDDNEEVLKLLNMMSDLSVAKKYLLLILPTFDSTKFANLTVNFQVMIHHKETG